MSEEVGAIGVVSLSEIMPEVCRQYFSEEVVCTPAVWACLTATAARQSTLRTVVQATLSAGSKMLLRSSNTGVISIFMVSLFGGNYIMKLFRTVGTGTVPTVTLCHVRE